MTEDLARIIICINELIDFIRENIVIDSVVSNYYCTAPACYGVQTNDIIEILKAIRRLIVTREKQEIPVLDGGEVYFKK